MTQHGAPVGELPSRHVEGTGPFVRRAWASLLRTSALSAPELGRADWIYLITLFLSTRVLIFFLGLLGAAMFPVLTSSQTFTFHPLALGDDVLSRLYTHFDSGWYISLSHGYPTPGGSDPDWLRVWAFWPLYPLILHAGALVLAILHVPGNVDVVTGVLISHAALFSAIVYLYRLASAELSLAAARRSVLYLLVFPASFFFSAVYPESLFLLLSVGAFYHSRRRQWPLAGIFAAFALLARPVGLFLILPIGLEFVADQAARWRSRTALLNRRMLQGLWLGLPFVSLAGYAVWSHAETGYWLAFVASESKYWSHTLTPPIYPLIRYVLSPDLGNAFSFDFRSVNFMLAVLGLLLVVTAWRRLPPAYSIWLLLSVIFPLSSNGHNFFGFARYLSVVFPAFLALGAWSIGDRWTPTGTETQTLSGVTLDLRDRLILIPSLLLLGVYVLMFTNSVYAAM